MPTGLRTVDYEYELPPGLIAQNPAAERDQSRLLVAHRATQRLEHRRFADLPEYLRDGDVLGKTTLESITGECSAGAGGEQRVGGLSLVLARPDA